MLLWELPSLSWERHWLPWLLCKCHWLLWELRVCAARSELLVQC